MQKQLKDFDNRVALVSFYPESLEQYKEYLQTFDTVVAVDSGVDALYEIGITPDLCIGDFDSANMVIVKQMPHVITLPVQKDETDTHAALNYVYQKENIDVTLFVSMSGRADQQFGLLSLYYNFVKQGCHLEMLTDQGKIQMLLPGDYVFQRNNEKYVSCFAYGEDVENLTITGALYPLKNTQLQVGSDLCCSNEFLSSTIELAFTKGTLLVYFIDKEVEGCEK